MIKIAGLQFRGGKFRVIRGIRIILRLHHDGATRRTHLSIFTMDRAVHRAPFTVRDELTVHWGELVGVTVNLKARRVALSGQIKLRMLRRIDGVVFVRGRGEIQAQTMSAPPQRVRYHNWLSL